MGSSGRCMAQLLRASGLAKSCDNDPIPKDFYRDMGNRGLRPLLWERSAYCWSNVFSEQLPENEIKNWCALDKERKDWHDYELDRISGCGFLRPEYVHHLQRLQADLATIRPTLIVPLGGTALWAFTGSNEISKARGAVAVARYICPGTKLLPTFHPANVIYSNFSMFPVVVSDLVKAAREAEYPEIRLPHREIHIEPSIEDLWEFKKKYLDKSDLISIDIETSTKMITCIGFASDSGRALVVPFFDRRNPNRSYWKTEEEELAAWLFVKEICENNQPKLFQNGPYDLYFLLKGYGIKVMNYREDTRLIHHALFPELPKSLQFMGATYANQGNWKSMRERKDYKRDG